MRHSFFPFAIILMLQAFADPTLAQSPIALTIESFEEPNATAGIVTTHTASLSVTAASPQTQAGKQAINTTIKQNAGTTEYFGMGSETKVLDLSESHQITFWIKTNIESNFNFQIHSDDEHVSVFKFSTIGGKLNLWKQISMPSSQFNTPVWAKDKADWTKIIKWQVTAFGYGPYDGKYITLDNIGSTKHDSPSGISVPDTEKNPSGLPLVFSTKPNIIFILADDLGWRDLSCYGSDFYETPNIDRLASQGLRFTDAYSAATVCSPTRAAVLTGKSPARLRITDFLSGLEFPYAALSPPDWQRQYLPHEEITLAEMLRSTGYETFYFGKWHLGGEEHFPATQGFEHTLAETQAGWPGTYFYPWPMVRNLKGEKGDYLTDRLTDEVIKSMEREHERPFFTFLSYFTPHRPTEGKREYIRKYEKKLKPEHLQRNAVNAAMIHSLDENVGRIMKTLKRLKLDDDTLLIFASDNGGNHYADTPQKTNNSPLRDGKGSAYEGAYRVPLIIRWPGVIHAGTTSNEPVTSEDFFPTLRAVSGQKQPQREDLDGMSLLPIFTNQQPLQREALYWHYPHYHHGGASPHGVIRKGRYRLIEHFDGTPAELYDLSKDIGETVNLINTLPGVAEDLQQELRHWRSSVDAQMPTINPNYDASRIHEAMFYHQLQEQTEKDSR
tara:strand:- start:1571 stop:3577 length:2007 start_codon:yes stop_codon:yes gene_type:complete